MRKFLFVLLMCLASMVTYAQSLSFEELANLTNMSEEHAHDYLLVSKGFKAAGTQLFNGRGFDRFISNRVDPVKTEVILLGPTFRTASGNISRKVYYSTLRQADIDAMLAQAKKSTMTLVFEGSDHDKNIYRFDNSLFMAILSIGFDKRYGSVQLEEK